MTRVGREEIAERVRTALRRAGMVLAGLAVVLLVWAAVLATWARLAAPRSVAEGAWYLANVHRWGEALPNRMALSVTVIALVLIAAMAYSVWRGRTGRDLSATPVGTAAVAALLLIAYVTQGIPEYYRMAMSGAPVTAALPAGMASWWLCLGGAAAALLAARAFPRLERGALRLPAIGAAVAVVVALVVTVAALRTGDDGRFVDASTAASIDAPTAPTALGQRTFTASVADAFADLDLPRYEIDSAGAGFVVYHDRRITAYGADGKERWHYARTGPGDVSVNRMRVVDNGATVLAFIDGGLVGLDADTGEQLWTSAEEDLVEAARGRFEVASGPYVVGWNDEQVWTRYDSRTGRLMWKVTAPHPDCGIVEPVVSPSGVLSLVQCEDGKVWLTALDAESGETTWDTMVLDAAVNPATPLGERFLRRVVLPANGVGVFLNFVGPGAPDGPMYANVVGRSITRFSALVRPAESPGPSDDFIVSEDPANRLALFGVDGHRRCQVDAGVNPVRTNVPGRALDRPAYVTMSDNFVVADRSGSLRTFDSTTCAQTASVPAESVQGFVPVPGAVLVLRRDGRTLQIDGYTAG